MTLVIHDGETQTAFVERVLREDGAIATYDVLYALRDDRDRPRSITRLAAVIHTLRHERGWDIAETHADGALAEYRVVRAPGNGRPIGRVRICPGCQTGHAVGTSCGLVGVRMTTEPAPIPQEAP